MSRCEPPFGATEGESDHPLTIIAAATFTRLPLATRSRLVRAGEERSGPSYRSSILIDVDGEDDWWSGRARALGCRAARIALSIGDLGTLSRPMDACRAATLAARHTSAPPSYRPHALFWWVTGKALAT